MILNIYGCYSVSPTACVACVDDGELMDRMDDIHLQIQTGSYVSESFFRRYLKVTYMYIFDERV